MPAVPLTGDTAPWPWVTVAPQPRSAQGSRRAQAQGIVLGPRTQGGFAQSQMAVALGKTLFPDGHQGWPVNLPSKENGGVSSQLTHWQVLLLFLPPCALSSPGSSHITALPTPQKWAWSRMKLLIPCFPAAAGQAAAPDWSSIRGSAVEQTKDLPHQPGQMKGHIFSLWHAGTRHWVALNTFSIAHMAYTYMGIYVYMEVWLQNCTKGVMRLWGEKA